MTAKMTIAAIALVIATTSAAFAQSDYTTGTISNSVEAGYPSPYGYGSHLYAYAPGYAHHHAKKSRR